MTVVVVVHVLGAISLCVTRHAAYQLARAVVGVRARAQAKSGATSLVLLVMFHSLERFPGAGESFAAFGRVSFGGLVEDGRGHEGGQKCLHY